VVRVTNQQTLKKLVLEGVGLVFLPQQMIQAELDSGELISLPLPKEVEPIQVNMDIVYKHQNSLGHIHHAFIQHLIDNKEA